jgi:hypothetical protein
MAQLAQAAAARYGNQSGMYMVFSSLADDLGPDAGQPGFVLVDKETGMLCPVPYPDRYPDDGGNQLFQSFQFQANAIRIRLSTASPPAPQDGSCISGSGYTCGGVSFAPGGAAGAGECDPDTDTRG